MADAQSFAAENQGANAEAISTPAVTLGAAAETQGAAAETQGAAAETRERRSGSIVKVADGALPWSVRKGFRVKAFGLAALQMWFVLAGVVILDPFLNPDDGELIGSIVLSVMVCTSVASLALLWVFRQRHPWNFVISLVTSLQAIVVWSILDTFLLNDSSNVSSQMLAIMAMTLSMMLLIVQIPLPENYECPLLFCGILCAWLAAFACDLVVISCSMGIPMYRGFLPGFGTLTCVLGLMFLTGRKMADGNPDAFMHVAFCMHSMQFLVLAIPIIMFLIRFGRGIGQMLDGYQPKKPNRREANGQTSIVTSNLPQDSQSV